MCRVLRVSRSGFYDWRSRGKSDRQVEDEQLTARMRSIHEESRGTYGSPRIHAHLQREGICVSRKRVERLMREAGLEGRVRRRFRTTTNSRHDLPIAPNVLDRDFSPESPDQVWAADITYIWTLQGWSYLAVLMDLHSRAIVGWALDDHLRTELVEEALRMALGSRVPSKEMVHHSDRGCQYASARYRDLLERHGIEVSMSRRANCWDNAVVESFFGTLKQELVYYSCWETRAQARVALHEYIEVFYNRQRLHSALSYRTPAEVDHEAA